jgi:hypothetical protein
MSAIFADIQAIKKEKENKCFKFMFRGIDDVYAAFHPIFAAHRVFLRVELIEHNAEDRPTREGVTLHHIVKVRFSFRSGEDGSEISSTTIGEASDTGDKGATKAMSIALKYLMFQTFLVPVDNPSDDADADGTQFQKPAAHSSAPAPRQTAPSAAQPRPFAPSRNAPASPGDFVIHFGKNKGYRLRDLPANSVFWYADEWPISPERSKDIERDRALKTAARAYADELDQNQDPQRAPTAQAPAPAPAAAPAAAKTGNGVPPGAPIDDNVPY